MDQAPDNNYSPGEDEFRATAGLSAGPEPCRSGRYAAIAVCAALILATATIFGQTIRYDFVNFDDDQYVSNNPHLTQGLGAQGIVWAFTTTRCSNWHPLTWLSYLLDERLYGFSPWGYHLTNVLLHGATAILLFLVLWRMMGDLWPSAFVAAVFAIHPLCAESVAWIAERKDVLSGLFFMLTLAAYLGYVRRPFSPGRYLTVLLLFALGLMAKPMLVTLPLVLLLLDYWPLGRTGSSASRGRLVVEKLPLLALSAASCVATAVAQANAASRLDVLPLSARIGNAAVSYVAYLKEFFYPVGLAVFYPHPKGSLPAGQVIGSLLLLTMITVGALFWRRRSPHLLVGWFWYVGMLVPVIGLLQVGRHAMADRYTYLPEIGLAIGLTWTAKQLFSLGRKRVYWGAAATAAVLVLMGCARQQTSYWESSEALWTHALECTGDNVVAHTNLGLALGRDGHGEEAVAEYHKALAIQPDDAKAHVNLGVELCRRGHAAAGVVHLREAVKLQPDDANAHDNLAVALLGQGRVAEAIAHFRQALQIEPDDADAHNNLGAVLAQSGRLAEAITHFQAALEINPNDAGAYCNLGNALASCGQFDRAILRYEQALSIRPGYAEASNNLTLVRSGRESICNTLAEQRESLRARRTIWRFSTTRHGSWRPTPTPRSATAPRRSRWPNGPCNSPTVASRESFTRWPQPMPRRAAFPKPSRRSTKP